MIPFLFPFIWGPATSTSTAVVPSVTTPFWVKDTPGAMNWLADGAQLLPRFQHIYPQESNLGWTKKDPVTSA